MTQTQTQTWQLLAQHRAQTADVSLLSRFDAPDRFQAFSAETDGLLLDYSKTALDTTALSLLERITAEPVWTDEDWKEQGESGPIPTKKVWHIRTLDDRGFRWENATFIRVPNACDFRVMNPIAV